MKDTSPLDGLLMIAIVVVCVLVGYSMGMGDARRDAIKAGVARWEVNPSTGETEFVFVKQ